MLSRSRVWHDIQASRQEKNISCSLPGTGTAVAILFVLSVASAAAERLQKFFNKNQQDATQIMLHVHKNGVGICGVYTFEVAEIKSKSVLDYAKKYQHPLQCTIEKV